ncbi:protein lin-9 homolog [Drosophila gunungcola]|uniref:protein lin-9 homolog n=1 Tax=Drosophila gunungcola TaxID=103775 RepID=UPI0022E7C7AA|nr:protein lin-9 homolog [Drosophila gunungcola]
MSIDPQTIKKSTNEAENCEENEFLAKFGLLATTKMTDIREHQLKKQKKMESDSEDDELFVKGPDFGKLKRIAMKPVSQRKTKKKFSRKNNVVSSDDDEEEEDMEETINFKTYSMPGQRLYNFLSQLSSHRWIWCEFVESFLDKPILAGAYDIERFISECCPLLGTRFLPRRGWQLLRRNMGKARRFSSAFIEQERSELERTRRIVRELQQYRFNSEEDGLYLDQIPKRIPLPLATDAKVTSLLQGDFHKGIIDGCIMDYDPQDSTYLVRFIKEGKSAGFSIQDSRLYSEQDSTALPLSIMMNGTKSDAVQKDCDKTAKSEMFGNKRYRRELLESVLQVKKLMDAKEKTVIDIAQMNEDFDGNSSGNRRDAKMTSQREKLHRRYAANMITLHRVNSDVLEPLHILHDHLAEYQKQEEEHEAKGGRPASEVYQKCRLQAELDLKLAASEKSLKIESDRTREFICNLHTILYLNGRLGRENSSDMEVVLADLRSHMVANMPQLLAQQFQDALDSLDPLRQEVVTIFKALKKPERFQITQQAPLQAENGIYNFVVEAQPDPHC